MARARVSVVREIDPSAHVSPDAQVGPYCVVGPHVTIGPHTVLTRRVSVAGQTTIGSNNTFAEGCVLGAVPQDLKYAGGSTTSPAAPPAVKRYVSGAPKKLSTFTSIW